MSGNPIINSLPPIDDPWWWINPGNFISLLYILRDLWHRRESIIKNKERIESFFMYSLIGGAGAFWLTVMLAGSVYLIPNLLSFNSGLPAETHMVFQFLLVLAGWVAFILMTWISYKMTYFSGIEMVKIVKDPNYKSLTKNS